MIILTASRVALVAAAGALLGWAAKTLAIWIAVGLDQSPAETPLFLLGLLCALTAVVALAVAVSQGRRGPMRALVPLAWIAAVVLVATALDWLVTLPAAADRRLRVVPHRITPRPTGTGSPTLSGCSSDAVLLLCPRP